ncbi:MAG: tetratricopeptide repeat protein [Pseudomonadota bacterium]
MVATTFKSAIVATKSSHIKSLYREALKDHGGPHIEVIQDPDEIDTHLKGGDATLLVIDWNLDVDNVVCLLNKVQGSLREIAVLIHTEKISGKAIAVGLEYSVDYVGNASEIPAVIKVGVAKAIDSYLKLSPIRSILSKIDMFRKKGDFKSAMLVLESTLEKAPNVAIIELELAAVYVDSGLWRDAEPIVKRLSEVQPPNLRAQHLYARVLMKKSQFKEAEALLNNCKLLNPYNAPRLVDLGRCILEQPGRSSEALTIFDEAIKLDPNLPEAKLGKSECLLAQGDIEDALELMKGFASPRELASVFNLAAIVNIRDRKFNDGIGLYQVALKSIKDDNFASSRLYFNAALGFNRWERPEDALKCLKKSLELDPTFNRSKSLLKRISDKVPGSLAMSKGAEGDHFESVIQKKEIKSPSAETTNLEPPSSQSPKKDPLAYTGFDDFDISDDDA